MYHLSIRCACAGYAGTNKIQCNTIAASAPVEEALGGLERCDERPEVLDIGRRHPDLPVDLREARTTDPRLAPAEVHVQQPSGSLELEVRGNCLGYVGARAVELAEEDTGSNGGREGSCGGWGGTRTATVNPRSTRENRRSTKRTQCETKR